MNTSIQQQADLHRSHSGGTWSRSRDEFVYAMGMPIAVVHTDNLNTAANTYYLSADAMGTPRRVLNRTGLTQHRRLVMDAWGQARLYPGVNTPPNAASSSVPSSTTINVYLPHRLPGQLQGPGEPLVENRYRYYVPTLGQYLTPDPMHQASVMSPGPQAYAYANGNPLKYSDRDGRLVEVYQRTLDYFTDASRRRPRLPGESGNGYTFFELDLSTKAGSDCSDCELEFVVDWKQNVEIARDVPDEVRMDSYNHEMCHVSYAEAFVRTRFAILRSAERRYGCRADCRRAKQRAEYQFSEAMNLLATGSNGFCHQYPARGDLDPRGPPL